MKREDLEEREFETRNPKKMKNEQAEVRQGK